MPTRRQFVRNAATLIGIGSPLAGVLGCRKSKGANGGKGPLHERIASKAGSRGSGKTLRILYPKGSLANLEPVVREFRALTSINVELTEAALDEISTEIVLGTHLGKIRNPFDVALPPTFGIPDLVEANAIIELDTFAAEHEPSELMQGSIYTLGDRYKGSLYGYQADGDAYTMFYNRDWQENAESQKRYQDEYGVALGVPVTWAELDRQMAFFHQPDKGRFGGSLFRTKNFIGWEFWIRLHSEGVYPVDDQLVPRLDSEAGLRALKSLIAAGRYLEPVAATNGLFENFASFADGTKYANIGWGGTQKYLRGKTTGFKGRLTHGMVPGGVVGGQAFALPYFNWGWNYVVSANSTQQELAYLFILFASTPRISTLAVREPKGYFDPFRVEHYADPEIEAAYGATFLDVQRESLVSCIPDFYLRGQGRYLSTLKAAVYEASLERISPKNALAAVSRKWQQITDELGRDSQIRQWKFLKQSYPAKLRGLLS